MSTRAPACQELSAVLPSWFRPSSPSGLPWLRPQGAGGAFPRSWDGHTQLGALSALSVWSPHASGDCGDKLGVGHRLPPHQGLEGCAHAPCENVRPAGSTVRALCVPSRTGPGCKRVPSTRPRWGGDGRKPGGVGGGCRTPSQPRPECRQPESHPPWPVVLTRVTSKSQDTVFRLQIVTGQPCFLSWTPTQPSSKRTTPGSACRGSALGDRGQGTVTSSESGQAHTAMSSGKPRLWASVSSFIERGQQWLPHRATGMEHGKFTPEGHSWALLPDNRPPGSRREGVPNMQP